VEEQTLEKCFCGVDDDVALGTRLISIGEKSYDLVDCKVMS